MSSWNKRLWRMAQTLENSYRRIPSRRLPKELPVRIWNRIVAARQRLQIADDRGWRRAAADQRRTLEEDIEQLMGELRRLRNAPDGLTLHCVPTGVDLYAELLGAVDEFGGVQVEDDELYVTTEPIRLEGIYLGAFEIRIDLARLGDPEPYRVVALDPHPAAANSETTHPHVSGEKPCLGEGKAAIGAALAEGRIGDVFLLIDRVLHTYGQGAAYTELSHWLGIPCHDCDDVVDEDDVLSCRRCEAALCGECVHTCCQCGSRACSDCATTCPRCDGTTCGRCLTACRDCEQEFCDQCLNEGVCDGCRETAEEAELDAAEVDDEQGCEDGETIDADPALHADGVGQAPVSP